MNDLDLLREPVFFEPNRVWRCYLGGLLLDTFRGGGAGVDGHFPEEWLASATRAENGAWRQGPDEGLSRIRGSGTRFADLLARHPAEALGEGTGGEIGVLCKFLDSAIRLPIQCHPDRAFARAHCHSEYGKTESWLILATREVNGEKPYLLFGFKPQATAERFRRAVLDQDVAGMCACLHRVEPSPGEVYFIPGRLPHAIGPGLLLLEVQEPTDLVVQPERRIGDVTLGDELMWGALDPATGLACFDYGGAVPLPGLLARYRLQPEPVYAAAGVRIERLVGPRHTDCFQVDKLTVGGEFVYGHETLWYVGIVSGGRGTLRTAGGEHPVQRGDAFFVSRQIERLGYDPAGPEPLEVHVVSRS